MRRTKYGSDSISGYQSFREGKVDDSYIRRSAIQNRIPYMTTIAAANATAIGIEAVRANADKEPKSLQEYHK